MISFIYVNYLNETTVSYILFVSYMSVIYHDDGAEVCELIGILLLNLLGRPNDAKNISLYRDDGLSIFKNCSGRQMENMSSIVIRVMNTFFF